MRSAVVIFSSGKEWGAAKDYYCPVKMGAYPYGECFDMVLGDWNLILLHGGWGKVPAAASAEYALTHWQPDLIINLGTCGGFSGRIERGEVILVNRTVLYDIVEQMGDQVAAIQRFAARLDLSWLRTPYPAAVRT
jgi:adenosylhomocysteine nucleosidase